MKGIILETEAEVFCLLCAVEEQSLQKIKEKDKRPLTMRPTMLLAGTACLIFCFLPFVDLIVGSLCSVNTITARQPNNALPFLKNLVKPPTENKHFILIQTFKEILKMKTMSFQWMSCDALMHLFGSSEIDNNVRDLHPKRRLIGVVDNNQHQDSYSEHGDDDFYSNPVSGTPHPA